MSLIVRKRKQQKYASYLSEKGLTVIVNIFAQTKGNDFNDRRMDYFYIDKKYPDSPEKITSDKDMFYFKFNKNNISKEVIKKYNNFVSEIKKKLNKKLRKKLL